MQDTLFNAVLGLSLLLSGLSLFLTLRLRALSRDLASAQVFTSESKQKIEVLSQRLSEEERLRLSMKQREQDLLAEHKAELQAVRHQQFAVVAEQKEEQAELAVLNFLRQLQERGRLLDFATGDIHRLPDAQVGAAARVVQQGVKSVLNDYFVLQPVRPEIEGTTLDVPEESEERRDIRVLQDTDSPSSQRKGRLVHRGWRAQKVNLPQSLAQSRDESKVLAPAEIQLS